MVVTCTLAALIGFAANSLLTRSAIGGGHIDAVSFTSVRLASGALALLLLHRLLAARQAPGAAASARAGAWTGAALLASYAYAFAYAYERIPAGAGALILFASVQATMTGWGVWRGDRPKAVEWAGLALALVGLWTLTRPGLQAPDPIGAALMAWAGASWGVYSLLGRQGAPPLPRTTANFVRAAVIGLALVAVAPGPHAAPAGLLAAAASGAVASGLGYTLWYMALPALSRFRAALVQLAVPVLTGAGAWLLLAEPLGARLLGSGALILGGIFIACLARRG